MLSPYVRCAENAAVFTAICRIILFVGKYCALKLCLFSSVKVPRSLSFEVKQNIVCVSVIFKFAVHFEKTVDKFELRS